MKVAVFSDVQGNIAAFEVVVEDILRWQPDLVIMNGDLINRGPQNRACLALFERYADERGWLGVRGNHEDYVLHCAGSAPSDERDAQLRRFADWTVAQLDGNLAAVAAWPDHISLQGDGDDCWLHLTHGTLAGNRDGISASVPDDALRGKIPPDVDLFVTAHTHKPLEREFQGQRILNVGSVGSPFDGDVRASYARIHYSGGHWQGEIVRLAYDRERSARDFIDSGFMDQAGPLARIIQREWQEARLLMPFWHRQYQKPFLAGEISLERAVEEFLEQTG